MHNNSIFINSRADIANVPINIRFIYSSSLQKWQHQNERRQMSIQGAKHKQQGNHKIKR